MIESDGEAYNSVKFPEDSSTDYLKAGGELIENEQTLHLSCYRMTKAMASLNCLLSAHNVTNSWEVETNAIINLNNHLIDASSDKLAILWVRARGRAIHG